MSQISTEQGHHRATFHWQLRAEKQKRGSSLFPDQFKVNTGDTTWTFKYLKDHLHSQQRRSHVLRSLEGSSTNLEVLPTSEVQEWWPQRQLSLAMSELWNATKVYSAYLWNNFNCMVSMHLFTLVLYSYGGINHFSWICTILPLLEQFYLLLITGTCFITLWLYYCNPSWDLMIKGK